MAITVKVACPVCGARLEYPHNRKSGGCRWFRGSFDTLSETCTVCE